MPTTTTTKAATKHEDILKAVQAVQLGLDPLTTDGINKLANDHRYATINNILRALKPLLKKYSLYLTQRIDMNEGVPSLLTVITHLPSGQYMNSMVHLMPDKPGPQALGSCITYLRRYSLVTIFQIDTQDDDGEAGEGRANILIHRDNPYSIAAEGRADSAEVSTSPAPSPKVESKQPSAEPPSEKTIKACYKWIDDKDRTIDELEVAERSIMDLATKCDPMDQGRIPAMFKIRMNRMKDLQKSREAGEVTIDSISEDLELEDKT